MGCQTTPPTPLPTQPATPTPNVVITPPVVPLLNWGREHDAWSEVLIAELVAAKAASLKLSDASSWCPSYAELDNDEKVTVLAHLLSAVAEHESNFNPKSVYVESFKDSKGNLVQSTGLFQLSIESAQQKRYDCRQVKSNADLMSPKVNIACAVKIAAYWMAKDGVLSSASNQGVGRYWSTMRPSSKAYNNIKGYVKALPLCN